MKTPEITFEEIYELIRKNYEAGLYDENFNLKSGLVIIDYISILK